MIGAAEMGFQPGRLLAIGDEAEDGRAGAFRRIAAQLAGDPVQAGRQIRFTNIREIEELQSILKAYIYEAIEVEKAGLKVELKKNTEYKVPE